MALNPVPFTQCVVVPGLKTILVAIALCLKMTPGLILAATTGGIIPFLYAGNSTPDAPTTIIFFFAEKVSNLRGVTGRALNFFV